MKRVRHLVLPVIVALGLLCLLLGLVVPVQVAHASGVIWSPTGSLNTARFDHTATLLPNGQVLVAGGFTASVVTTSAELYDPSTGSWTPTGSLTAGRGHHTATLLPNGRVLVAGGNNSSVVLASAELYDPVTGNWSPTGSLNTARNFHTATLLPNGRVLVAGGNNSGVITTSAELGFLDTTAPVLNLPGTLTVNATSPAGAAVTYTVSASDPDNPASQLTIGCTPASGSTFPIGTTTVNCTASDPAGNSVSGSFQVVVQDITAPTLSLPGTITVNASSPSGAVVSYTVTATDPDNAASQLTISCSPSSGSTFAIGTTTVTCTASDPSGNTATGSFQVVVKGAAAQVSNLISLVNSFHLTSSLQNALDNKLQDVLTATNAGQTATVCSELTDFIGFVQSHIGKGITSSQAQQLIAAAQQIRAVLGC